MRICCPLLTRSEFEEQQKSLLIKLFPLNVDQQDYFHSYREQSHAQRADKTAIGVFDGQADSGPVGEGKTKRSADTTGKTHVVENNRSFFI